MKYLLLVSHGNFSRGLKQTLSMFVGNSIDTVLAIGLCSNESADTLENRVDSYLRLLPKETQFIVLADIIGGSPLTVVCNVLNKQKRLAKSVIIGGMNFPMALTAIMSKETLDIVQLKNKILTESTRAIKSLDIPDLPKDSYEDI